NGILVPKYEPKGYKILVKGREIPLSPEQEQMAVAWVKKLGTEYVNDRTFVKNFFKDFSKALGLGEEIGISDVDFSEIIRNVEADKASRLAMSREEKKKLAEQRKAIREANKLKYGYAIVDGAKVEIGNYMAEPGCIFMGRGDHPLRGRWKPGVEEKDVTLNLSPDAARPPGDWKAVVWEPDSMWVAKWVDKLRGKVKYVWLSDSSAIKQRRDKEKFDKAMELESKIGILRDHIMKNLESGDPKRKKLATVCYLIDDLKLRVGDEKDKDEADTVGATTLRPEHISFRDGGTVVFDFLGKDAVRWRKEVKLPQAVVANLKELVAAAESSIFKGVRSENVKLFLSEAVPDISAKVLRTYHASKAVVDYLKGAKASRDDPDYVKKFHCAMANLRAAEVCNHKRKLPKNWHESLAKKTERLKQLRSKKTRRSAEAAKELRVKIRIMKATRDYNLGTSLKSYIDPRIYRDWCREVGYDWKLYYPKTLQRKFSWVEAGPS
ncbi:MAG: DNA topoisomerase I, partial [Thermoproteota archaeon]